MSEKQDPHGARSLYPSTLEHPIDQLNIFRGPVQFTSTITAPPGQLGVYVSSGSPEGVVTAGPGSICSDTLNGDVYLKRTGTGNTGWVVLLHA